MRVIIYNKGEIISINEYNLLKEFFIQNQEWNSTEFFLSEFSNNLTIINCNIISIWSIENKPLALLFVKDENNLDYFIKIICIDNNFIGKIGFVLFQSLRNLYPSKVGVGYFHLSNEKLMILFQLLHFDISDETNDIIISVSKKYQDSLWRSFRINKNLNFPSQVNIIYIDPLNAQKSNYRYPERIISEIKSRTNDNIRLYIYDSSHNDLISFIQSLLSFNLKNVRLYNVTEPDNIKKIKSVRLEHGMDLTIPYYSVYEI